MSDQKTTVNIQLTVAPLEPIEQRAEAAIQRAIASFTHIEGGAIVYDDITKDRLSAAILREFDRDGIELGGFSIVDEPAYAKEAGK